MEKQKISRKFIHLNKLAVYSDLLTNTEKMHTQPNGCNILQFAPKHSDNCV